MFVSAGKASTPTVHRLVSLVPYTRVLMRVVAFLGQQFGGVNDVLCFALQTSINRKSQEVVSRQL